MQLTDTVLSVMDLLSAEFDTRKSGKFSVLSDISPGVCGMVAHEFESEANGSFAHGANCECFVVDGVVVKWYRNGLNTSFHRSSADKDFQVFQKARELQLSEHFAESEQIGRFLVQEEIFPFEEWQEDNSHIVDDDHKFRSFAKLAKIAKILHLGDLHNGNWGFRPSDISGDVPVIFDWSDCRKRNTMANTHKFGLDLNFWDLTRRDAFDHFLDTL